MDECIRSWTFDDAGGFTDGRWTRDGERWLVREVGYAADGSRTTADNTLTKSGAGQALLGIHQPHPRRRSAAWHRPHRNQPGERRIRP